ncbi:MAG TPA: pantoate--beta-alanine ligase [Armatimonadota bacterium]
MQLVHTIAGIRSAVASARMGRLGVGFVATMGALHQGHLSLIREARARDGLVVVSIFVNPTQFGPQEDFAQYPRTLEADAVLCREAGVDLIFAPSAEEMYPPGFSSEIVVAGITDQLEGRFRPGHFNGVATVVAKLFSIVQPDDAYFGQKDYQQLLVVRRMAADLDLPVRVVGCPTLREADGLALSSRNRYLSPEQRQAAPRLYQALQAGAEVLRTGGSGEDAVHCARKALASESLFRVQYLVAADPATLEPQSGPVRPAVLLAAAHLGETRLIDNLIVD